MKDFIGNPQIVKLFQNLPKEELNHAYLFCGKKGLGKFTLAQKLALSLQCKQGKILEPCGNCPDCLQIEKGSHSHTIILSGEDKISIEAIRQIQRKINLKSTNNQLKVTIIDDAERLTPEASNCLLKTLEEPPASSLFILVSSKPELLPATIRSRCQLTKFLPAARKELRIKLQELLGAVEINQEILDYADGSIGKAINFIRDADLQTSLESQRTLLTHFLNDPLTKRLQLTGELSKLTFTEIKQNLEDWLFIANIQIKASAKKAQTAQLIKLLLEIKAKTDYNLNKRVLLDQLALKAPRIQW